MHTCCAGSKHCCRKALLVSQHIAPGGAAIWGRSHQSTLYSVDCTPAARVPSTAVGRESSSHSTSHQEVLSSGVGVIKLRYIALTAYPLCGFQAPLSEGLLVPQHIMPGGAAIWGRKIKPHYVALTAHPLHARQRQEEPGQGPLRWF
ncbi:hypothetical protein NDU88_002242 [Pleurodeles waltl]|uniref:Uncharacterized protein n=1 Tax=Pleurodeles waltl TaxID=8319 RepID=A0AAV7WKP3_PLEWA|nr:hypothetical protein NDU88_002242 [Pleurodeles waltl]